MRQRPWLLADNLCGWMSATKDDQQSLVNSQPASQPSPVITLSTSPPSLEAHSELTRLMATHQAATAGAKVW